MPKRLLRLLIILVSAGTPLLAQSAPDYAQLARDILRELIEIKSTESGVGSTPAAEAVSRRLLAAGFPAADVQLLGPEERKQNVVARLHGKGKGRPILLLSHLDVVEAHAEDWSNGIDPFKFTERDGYFYGRGTQDVKDGAAILITNFIRWKQQGWVPDRDLILALTADEETGGANGVAWLLAKHRDLIDVEYCVNTDSGDFQSKNGKPEVVAISAAEKRFGMMQLQTTNRGGHGSLPRKDNAIYQLATALGRVAAVQLPVMLNEVTRAQFAATANTVKGQLAVDMKAVTQPTPDPMAVKRLSQDPYYNALLRTTCVATMIQGGHAENALPQRAKAELNCRLLPGQDPADVLKRIKQVVNDEGVEVTWTYLATTEAAASTLRPDVVTSVETVSKRFWPGIIVIPTMDSGASDGRILRNAGIPTYGVSGMFIDQGDTRSHGRDERIRAKDFFEGVEFYDVFVKTLVGSPQE